MLERATRRSPYVDLNTSSCYFSIKDDDAARACGAASAFNHGLTTVGGKGFIAPFPEFATTSPIATPAPATAARINVLRVEKNLPLGFTVVWMLTDAFVPSTLAIMLPEHRAAP